MTKPAKPGTLRYAVEHALKDMPGYEDLNLTLRATPDGKRADYLAFGRRAIIEQEEHLDSPEHRAKGRAMQEEIEVLEAKYRRSMIEIVTATPPVLTDAERAIQLKGNDKFYQKQNQNSHDANKQIASTKRILGLPNAVGVLLLIFDQVPGMMPEIIRQRAQRDFNARICGAAQFEHIDLVVFACHLKDLTVEGSASVNGYIIRDGDNDEHRAIARGILDTFKSKAVNPRPRTSPKRYDPFTVRMLREDIFAEPVAKRKAGNKK